MINDQFTNRSPGAGSEKPATANRKRVLMLLTNAFEPDPRVHQEALSLIQNGYDVVLLCWDRDHKLPPEEVIDGIKIERIYVRSTHGRGSTQVPFLLLFWLKTYGRGISKDFSIVHCHDFDTLPLGYVLAKRKKAKLIYDAHESYTDMLTNLPGWFKKAVYRIENFLLKRIDLLITVGEILRETFEKRGVRRSCVVGNWKDPSKFKFPPEFLEDEKQRLHISNGQLVIAFVGNLGEERQLTQLIEAVKETPAVTLVVGGDGPCRGVVQEAARKYSNIIYLGYVHPSKVPLYTAICDMIYYGFDPSNPNSKFSAPNKLFEALAAGKAVLTGDFGEIGRIVKETKCGIIVSNYSTMELKKTLASLKAETLDPFKENAYRHAISKYNWKNASLILISQYSSLLISHLKTPPCGRG
jgi:glycosyltransferase involved in cell wall biosynthesis